MKKCLNVAMTRCFWCGESSGVAIGKQLVNCDNKWETKYVFADYEPCQVCKDKFDEGFLIMEASEFPVFEGQPEMQRDVYPTSTIWLVNNEFAQEIFNDDIFKYKKAFVTKEFAEQLGLYQDLVMNKGVSDESK